MTTRILVFVILTIALLTTGCAQAQSVSVQVPEPDYWPTEAWRASTPASQGMDSEMLARMLAEISTNDTSIHSVLVIRNGYMVTEAYFHPYARDTRMHIQSVTKSVIGMLVGRAIAGGYIDDAEQKLVDFYQGRIFENPSKDKSSIRLKHLLSMSSGFDCQEFSSTGTTMEQTQGWVQFMLDRPMTSAPGEVFGYCNGNPHLLSSILEKTTGMSAREYANRELFQPLGIPPVDQSDWGSDPQGITIGGYGLHLRPIDMAKLALLSLNNGRWDGVELLPPHWLADSTTEQIQKEDGSGYGYLWTVYPQSGHYAALGLGGQQIHVYPAKNLIVVVAASLESYAEAPEVERMLNDYVLPAIKADNPLPENPGASSRLQAEIDAAANPVQPVAALPATALDVSESIYSFDENPLGWEKLEFVFEPGEETAQLVVNDASLLEIGLDNIFRLSSGEALGELLLRGKWADEQTFVVDYPYPLVGPPVLGELGEAEIRFKFTGDDLEVIAEQTVFGGEPLVVKGSR